MAMDKDRLLQYFQQHYLSRQEVLFKLPLNVSIDTFWPELLNRRKAGAIILPLSNAAGMPYWYVLTEKMIAASERLCAEAMEQEECFDPYRAPMTSAMTEEMFFTSFVEGAGAGEHPGADDLEQPSRLVGHDRFPVSPPGRGLCQIPCFHADRGNGQLR